MRSQIVVLIAFALLLLTPVRADGPPTDPNWRPKNPALLGQRGAKPSYDHVAADVREWFRSQKSPKTGMGCCDEADGGQAQEKIEDGKYWASWCVIGNSATGECARSSGWIEVPDDVVIKGPNITGHPVVWSYYENGKPKIRCYAPGSGI